MSRNFVIAVYFEDFAYLLTSGTSDSNSAFGGTSTVRMRGIRETIYDVKQIHYLGHVSSYDVPPLAPHLSKIPLFYGFAFEGCQVQYELESPTKASLLNLRPARPLRDFPYPDYPAVFPKFPLMLARKQRMSYSQFTRDYPNMSEKQSADVVILVPPALSLGISLWGKYGDADDITVVFEYDLRYRTVNAYSHCT